MKRIVTGLALLAVAGAVVAQPPAGAKPITSVYGHDLRVRPAGQKDFLPTTPKVGVDFFHDAANGCLLAVTEAGNLAAVPFAALGNDKKPDWQFGHDLRVRKGDEAKFTQATKKYGIEAVKDLASGKLVYATETKAVAFADVPMGLATDKEAAFSHGLVLHVRDSKQQDWTNAKKYGVEAFRDGNTGGLLFLSETGSVATAAAPAKEFTGDPKAPKLLHGLALRVRKADEEDFTAQTRNVAVEVYSDVNSGAVVFVSETGAVAAAPAPAEVKKSAAPVWKGAFKVRARKGGEKDFAAAAKYGVEVFEDVGTGYLVYASETGSIAVVAKK